jgi:hypothetical protein
VVQGRLEQELRAEVRPRRGRPHLGPPAPATAGA